MNKPNSALTYKTIIAALVAGISGILIFQTYNVFVNRTVAWIVFKGQFSNDTKVELYSISNDLNTVLKDEIIVKGRNSEQRVASNKLNTHWGKIKLVFTNVSSDDNASVYINTIKIHRAYKEDITIYSHHLNHFFDLTSPIATQEHSNVVITNANNVNTLISKQPLSKPNTLKALSLALLFSIAVFFIVKHVSWNHIPAFSDMALGKDISSKHEFGIINGLRGLAALLVLFSHTAPGFYGIQIGLALLLVISGFLLTKPFILDPSKIYSYHNIEAYLTKRLKRILPMYYLYIFLIYVVSLKIDVALRHFLFVQAEGHLWPMTQIFAFYFLLPFILLFTSLLYRVARILPIIVLSIVCYFWIVKMDSWTPFYNGTFYRPFFLYAFLMGVIGSYFQYSFIENNNSIRDFLYKLRWPFGILALVFTALTIAWAAPIQPPQKIAPYVGLFHFKCLYSLAIILFALNNKDTIYSWIMSNWLFRSVGIIGFSFYIWHGLGMKIVLAVQTQLLAIPNPSERSWSFMLMTFVVTYILSVITYSYVERPFFGFRKRKNNVE